MKKVTLTNTAPANLQAPDSESGAADGSESTSKRKQVSKRSFLLANGSEADRIEEATGARYTLLAPSGNKDYDQQFGDAGKFATMCAIFGFHTKVGNVANTVLNDKDEPGTPDEAGKAIEEFIATAQAGTWAERSEGGVGARIDKNALAGAIVEVATAAGKTADLATVLQWLEEGRPAQGDKPALSAQQYTRMTRQVPDVAAAYAARVGKATKTVADLI